MTLLNRMVWLPDGKKTLMIPVPACGMSSDFDQLPAHGVLCTTIVILLQI